MTKTIQLTFVRWCNSDNPEMLMSIGNCEHTVMLDKLPRHSRIRFLAWAMSQDWEYRADDSPNYNGTYNLFDIFTVSHTGEDTPTLRTFLDMLGVD